MSTKNPKGSPSRPGSLLPVLLSACAGTICQASNADDAAERAARRILETTGVQGGLVVHVGCGDGRLTAALDVNDSYLIHGLDVDAANVEKARDYIRSRDLAGKVSVERWRGGSLPYADNLVNLLIVDSRVADKVDSNGMLRVLVPDGVAYVEKNGKWTKKVKPRPPEIDEWTHYLHDATNNAVARDSVVGPPRHIQWLARPLYGRSHEIDTSVSALVSARGRIFYVLDEGLTGITDERLPATWSLIARDAFNGLLLWKRPMPHWGWREWKREELEGKDWTGLRGQRLRSPVTLPRRLIANGERVYVTLGYEAPVSELDAATGETLRTFEGTEHADEILYSRGVLVACIRPTPATAGSRRTGEPVGESVVAIRVDSGERLWEKKSGRILPLSLAVATDRVVFHGGKKITCSSLETGEPMWHTPNEAARGNGWNSAYTLVVQGGVVLFLAPKRLSALSAETGQELWKAAGIRGAGVANPPDLFVADGLVWYGGMEGKRDRQATRVKKSGRDLTTGRIERTVEVPSLITPGHHFRCYRSKATERYLLWPKRGAEFLDLVGESHARHDWLRPACRLGLMPCNGLLYVTPHQCFCYPGVKLSGFNALAPQRETPSGRPVDDTGERLEAGLTYAQAERPDTPRENENDWPTYRRDLMRSGAATSTVPLELEEAWRTEIGGRITPPVAVGRRVFVASVDRHRVWCLDADDGKPVWSYIAGGRVDSPPTVYQGLVLFGSADGWVYCLRAADGALVWRFRGGPEDRRVVAFGQLESAWPIHGSVLVQDGVAYFAAGRSSYLDGGIRVYGLDPRTGKVRYETRVDGPHPDVTRDVGWPFDMEGANSDVLVSDGAHLYMQQVAFDRTLARQEAPRLTDLGDRKLGRHLFATGGFLDYTGWNRTFWMYSERWPGFYIANQAPKTGQLLVFDATTTYGVKYYTRRNRHSPMFFPGKEGYLLFADDNDTEPVLVDDNGLPKPVKWLPEVNEAVGQALDAPAVNKDKGTGFTRAEPPKWATWVPIRIRAMVLASRAAPADGAAADKTLFVAGPPDVLDPEDPLGAFEGRKGAHLWAVSARDGRKLTEYPLDSPPVFDGMIVANDRLYLSNRNGELICMGKK